MFKFPSGLVKDESGKNVVVVVVNKKLNFVRASVVEKPKEQVN